MPKVVVWETFAGIRRGNLEDSLSRLLRSGRPVDVVITLDESAYSDDDLSGTLPDLGGIAVANREAFVLQSSLACPQHALAGLQEMVRTVRPSLALISSHSALPSSRWGWACELLALNGRLAPAFCYSPDRGPTWSDRIDISGNPQLAAGQPVLQWSHATSKGDEQTMEEAVTLAHLAALRPEYRAHFQLIPASAWSDEQVPIGQYLEKFRTKPPATLPFIWVIHRRQLCRAIITRELVNACRDRKLAWRNLQELAGINNEYVNKAELAMRQELQLQLKADAESVRAAGRQEGAQRAVQRIVDALLGPHKAAGEGQSADAGDASGETSQ